MAVPSGRLSPMCEPPSSLPRPAPGATGPRPAAPGCRPDGERAVLALPPGRVPVAVRGLYTRIAGHEHGGRMSMTSVKGR